MNGSLEAPPIVISTSRVRVALFLLASVGFVSLGMFLSHANQLNPGLAWLHAAWWAWFFIVAFGISCCICIGVLVSPSRLILDPTGVTWRSLGRTVRYEWWQLHDIRILPPEGVLKARLAVEIVSERGGEPQFDGFAGFWELSPTALCDLLNQARDRWARP